MTPEEEARVLLFGRYDGPLRITARARVAAAFRARDAEIARQVARAEAAEAAVLRLREALLDQTTGPTCWCDASDLEPGESHTDYCRTAQDAYGDTADLARAIKTRRKETP